MTDKHDKLVETALNDAYEKGWCAAAQWANRDDLRHDTGSIAYEGQRDAILSGNAAGLVASLCADVEPVAWLVEWEYLAVQEWRGGQKTARETWVKRSTVVDSVDEAIALIPEEKVWRNKTVSTLYPASTVASLTAQRDAALARVAELEKDAARYRWLRSVPNAFKAQRIVNDTPHGMDATIDAAMNGGNQ